MFLRVLGYERRSDIKEVDIMDCRVYKRWEEVIFEG
jgi:hypothetical protein